MTLTTESAEATIELGRRLGVSAQPGLVICLIGDLGAGKTTLTKGIAAALGVQDPVRSPTFTLVHEHQGETPLTHIDLYRLEDLEQVAGLGLEEYFENGVTVIEWADRAAELMPEDRLEVRMSAPSENERRFELAAHGPVAAATLINLEAANADSGD